MFYTTNNFVYSKTTQMQTGQKCVLNLEHFWVPPPLPHSALVQMPAFLFYISVAIF